MLVCTFVGDSFFEINYLNIFDTTNLGKLGHNTLDNARYVFFKLVAVFFLLLFRVVVADDRVAVNKTLFDDNGVLLGNFPSRRKLLSGKVHGKHFLLLLLLLVDR